MQIKYFILILTIFVFSANAAIIHVPTDQLTIQAGIDAALDSDTILVADDTYTGTGNRDLNFGDKNLVLMSENGPDVTTIDCGGTSLDPHNAINLLNNQDSTTIIDGFTIQNAYDTAGWYKAAIYCHMTSPTIRNCNISNNTCNGIFCYSYPSRIIVENCKLTNNYRCGLYVQSFSSAYVNHSEFSHNGYTGAYIYTSASILTEVYNSLFHNNTYSGLEIIQNMQFKNVHINNNTFVENRNGLFIWMDFPKNENTPSLFITGDDNTEINYNISSNNTQRGIVIDFEPEYYDYDFLCNNSYGNPDGNFSFPYIFYPGDIYGTLSLDPLFCDASNGDYRISASSSCAPANNSCGTMIGALAVGCENCCVMRGDTDHDGEGPNVADLVYLVNYLFKDGQALPCFEEGDIVVDSDILVNDLVFLVNYVFKGGDAPPDC
ncbi:MAG: right-handed parallel beta-helix repeat-containing protein [bacterium]